MARTGDRLVEGALEAAFREAGEWLMHIGSAVVVAVIAGWPRLWVPPAPPQPSQSPANIPKIYGKEVFYACVAVVVLAGIFSIGWLIFVRLHRPGSPQEARRFRAWWLIFAAVLLLSCTVILVGGTTFGPVRIWPWMGKLDLGEYTLLIALLVLSASLVWYLISVFRSPPTVISAVPFGSYFARLRWR